METSQLTDMIKKFAPMVAILYVAYSAYGYYQVFQTAPDSPLVKKQRDVTKLKGQNKELSEKLNAATEFFKTLEAKKADILTAAAKLEEMKGALSDTLDVPDFMKMTVTEAKRVGLTVLGIRPMTRVTKEYYIEQPFEFKFRGAFVQLLIFLERLSNVQRIVRVDNFEMRPIGSNTARYVELEGVVEVKTYRYQGSKADEVTKKDPNKPPEPDKGKKNKAARRAAKKPNSKPGAGGSP